jgi:hypothetical protein
MSAHTRHCAQRGPFGAEHGADQFSRRHNRIDNYKPNRTMRTTNARLTWSGHRARLRVPGSASAGCSSEQTSSWGCAALPERGPMARRQPRFAGWRQAQHGPTARASTERSVTPAGPATHAACTAELQPATALLGLVRSGMEHRSVQTRQPTDRTAKSEIDECGFHRSGVLCPRLHNVRLDWLPRPPSSAKDEDLNPCP